MHYNRDMDKKKEGETYNINGTSYKVVYTHNVEIGDELFLWVYKDGNVHKEWTATNWIPEPSEDTYEGQFKFVRLIKHSDTDGVILCDINGNIFKDDILSILNSKHVLIKLDE